MAVERTAPIPGIFDEAEAKAFDAGLVGGNLDWEQRSGADFPLYAQASRAGLTPRPGGRHGDGAPGSTVFVHPRGVRALQREPEGRNRAHVRPSVEQSQWRLVTGTVDPFGDRIRSHEPPAA
ncbi:MAG: VOC family protein [Rhodospirillales bacterium]|nr:MAG: VOC family protein [Rhodospirillales bacterium]